MEMETPRSYHNTVIDQYYPESDWSDYEDLMKYLCQGDKRGVLDCLSKGCRVVRPGTFNTPLHLAVERVGWAFIVKQLLDRGARVNFVNSKNDTALHHAFLCEAPDMAINGMVMSYLKDMNANLVNNEGVSYLHIMCARSKLIYVKEILEGANVYVNSQVNMRSRSAYAGYTALHFAVEFGNADIAEYLVNNNASIYVQDANGSTALHLACYRRNTQIIDILLDNDQAHINVIDNLGTSHFVAACMSSNATFVNQYIIVAYRRYHIAPITLVSSKMCDSPVYPFPAYTPLHFAAEFGCLESVKMLLDYGAFCCAASMTGETPYALAMKASRAEFCDVLRWHCEALVSRNKLSSVAQSKGSLGFMNASTPETSIDSASYQDYSPPDSTYYSTSQSCEQSVTSVDLSTWNCQ